MHPFRAIASLPVPLYDMLWEHEVNLAAYTLLTPVVRIGIHLEVKMLTQL